MKRRSHFWSALVGGLFAALMVTALPAVASQVGETLALSSPGDPFALGETNAVNARSMLLGDAGTQPNLVIRNTGNRSPLVLQTLGNGRPPMIVDSAKKVTNLNADRLDGYHSTQLIRAAFGSTLNADDANGDASSPTITAPKAGVLIMGGSIGAFTDGAAGDVFSCELQVNGVTVPGTNRLLTVADAGGDHTRNSHGSCSTSGGHVVAAGTHEVALNIDGRETAALTDASVWVIWVPFDGLGTVPIIFDNPTTEPVAERTIDQP